jgi:hypothetical protein
MDLALLDRREHIRMNQHLIGRQMHEMHNVLLSFEIKNAELLKSITDLSSLGDA